MLISGYWYWYTAALTATDPVRDNYAVCEIVDSSSSSGTSCLWRSCSAVCWGWASLPMRRRLSHGLPLSPRSRPSRHAALMTVAWPMPAVLPPGISSTPRSLQNIPRPNRRSPVCSGRRRWRSLHPRSNHALMSRSVSPQTPHATRSIHVHPRLSSPNRPTRPLDKPLRLMSGSAC